MKSLANILMSDLFIPHGHCYLWKPELVGLHLVADLTIAIAYFSIPLTLFYFVEKREDLPFNWIFSLFGAFIILCGTTHLLEVWTLWYPVYWLSGAVKAITAIVSAYTAVVLVKLIPQALLLPSPAQLTAANQALQQQIRDRELAEAQIQQLNDQLEIRVVERTQELEASMLQVRDLAERMELAIDAAQMGACDWNILTQKIIWNDYHVKLLGYTPGAAEYSYEDWARRVHPEDLPRVNAAIEQAMATQTDYSSEYRVIWEDGSIHWINGFGRFYYNLDLQPIRMTGIAEDITERKQAELALATSEERLKLAIDSARMGTFDWNLVTQTVTWNAYHQALLGYDALEIGEDRTYAAWERRVAPEDLPRVKAEVQRARDTHTDYTCEYRVIWADGSIHWIEAFGRFYYDLHELPVRMTGVINDITERKQDEVALRRSEEFNRQILEHNNDCIKVLDLDGRLLYMNDGGKRLLEIDDFSQYDGQFWVKFWDGSGRQDAELAIETAKTGEVYRFEAQCQTAKGKLKCWDVVVSPMLNERGNVDRILSISHDITERTQAEAAIRESEQRFRSTFEQAAVGVAHVGVQGEWLRVNQKLCEILGYTEIELLDRTFQDITYPEDLPTDLDYVRQLLAGEIETYAMEKRYIHKLGEIVWANLTVSLRRDASGAPRYFIAVVESINERKQAEFELQEKTIQLAETALLVKQRNQDLDQFAHIVSHDLKAPLRAISNLTTWIEDDLEGQIPAETQEHLALMRSRVDRMEGLINGLLEYARVGNTPANLATFNLEDLLAEIIDTLSISSSFTIDLPKNLPPITTNRLLLSQVLANLLGNAYKHHERSDGWIKVGAQHQEAIWTFTVADDGPGIAPENQERVFNVFQTLAPHDRQENTGIGLSIVKKIVESQGGNITLESEIGRGTTFKFTWMVNERKV
jgi:PAS domain S-box-containing protein